MIRQIGSGQFPTQQYAARAAGELGVGSLSWWCSGAATQLVLRSLGVAASHRFLASVAGLSGTVVIGSCIAVTTSVAVSRSIVEAQTRTGKGNGPGERTVLRPVHHLGAH